MSKIKFHYSQSFLFLFLICLFFIILNLHILKLFKDNLRRLIFKR
nr:MAG TPA: hypothetical protein [Caudoviricetes sp.]